MHSDEHPLDMSIKKDGPVHSTFSDSSAELCMHSDSDERPMDSGICDKMIDSDMLVVMEQKIDRLSGEYRIHCT